MRTHIAKVLKARSQAIKNTIKKYNEAATALDPPPTQLEVAQVLEYVFLGQFNLLRYSQFQVQQYLWTRPSEREATVLYFKIKCLYEEIVCVNVEACRLQSYICNMEHSYCNTIVVMTESDPPLAHQLAI